MTTETERVNDSDPEPHGTRKSLRNFKDFAVLAVGLVSGVASLASPSTEMLHLLLIVVGVACFLYLVVRLWLDYFVSRTRDLTRERDGLRRQLVIQREGHQRYVDAIQRIIDREAVLFEEKLQVTVIVGDTDDEDLIIERRCTTPTPRVVHRSMRPILPFDNAHILHLEDISYSVSFPDGQHRVDQFPMMENGHLRVWLIFDTALSAETEWLVRYRPKGLWGPFRQKGRDKLRWRDQLPTAKSRPSALTEFVVTFLFPAGRERPQVSELNGLGTVKQARMSTSGQWEVEWRDDAPDGRYYEWELT